VQVTFKLNNQTITDTVHPGMTLLDYLREKNYYSVKHGCDHGECGACSVLVDGKALNACLVLVHWVEGKSVETLEGMMHYGEITPLQQAFIDHGAIQCGFCTPAMVITSEALLRENPNPTEADVRDAMSGVLCRCTGYFKPVEAVVKFAKKEDAK